MDCMIYVAKAKVIISGAFTVQLICTFVFTNANKRPNGPVNAHLISEQIISTKPGYK